MISAYAAPANPSPAYPEIAAARSRAMLSLLPGVFVFYYIRHIFLSSFFLIIKKRVINMTKKGSRWAPYF
jgi:hypothetical protein